MPAADDSDQPDQDEIVYPTKLVSPSDIIKYLKESPTSLLTNIKQNEIENVNSENTDPTKNDDKNNQFNPPINQVPDNVINQPHAFPSYVTSQHALAKYVVDNNLITLVPTQSAFVVQGRGGKYCVTLNPKETCQCPSTTTCFHILAAKISIGQEPIGKKKDRR